MWTAALGQAEPLPDASLPGVMVFVFTADVPSRDVQASDEGELKAGATGGR